MAVRCRRAHSNIAAAAGRVSIRLGDVRARRGPRRRRDDDDARGRPRVADDSGRRRRRGGTIASVYTRDGRSARYTSPSWQLEEQRL
jgi:hypothetical protein